MTETAEVPAAPIARHERFEWYQINSFLQEMGQAAVKLGLKPEDAVHIGGTANFYRSYQAFGSKAVNLFRGTHDMDVVSFNQGSVRRLLDNLKSDDESQVQSYSIRHSTSLPDKKSAYVSFDTKTNPGLSSGFAMDVYESSSGTVIFNNRRMTKDKIILDPPESIELATLNPGKTRGLVSVPSMRDGFIIKMDVVDFSKSGLRPKDKIDVLTTISVCDAIGEDFEKLLAAISLTSDKPSAEAKFRALEVLFNEYKKTPEKFSQNPQLMPSVEQVQKAAEAVRKVRHSSSQTLPL